MSFLRGFSFNLAGTGLNFALGFAVQVLLARHLGQELFGPYGVLSTTVLLGAMLFGEWLSRGNTYVVGREGLAAEAAGNSLLYSLALLLLLLLAAGLGAWLFHPAHLVRWLLVAALIALVVAQKGGQAILLGQDRLSLYAALPVLMIALYLGGAALVIALGTASIEAVLLAWLCAYAIAAAATFAPFWRGACAAGRDKAAFRRTLDVGGRGAVSVLLVFLLFRSDLYLVDYFMDDLALGTYNVAAKFAELMQHLPNIAGLVLLPKVIRGQDEGAVLSLRVARWVLLFSLAAAAGLALLGPYFLALFFPLFPGAYAPLAWMLPGLVLSGYGSVLNTKLAGLGYPPVTLWAPALALALNLALNLWLIPLMGLVGAALSTSIAYALWALLATLYYLKHTGLKAGALLATASGPLQRP